jgi:membrane fusion protein (multidrug efflux system)
MPADQSKPALRRRLAIIGFIAVCAGALIVGKGIFAREDNNAQLRDWTDAQAMPTVAVAKPGIRALDAQLEVPGRLEAYYRAPIFARVSGYVKDWKVDIGAHVKANQLLAEIDAPDLDQQLLQARAELLNADAATTLSAATLKRRQTLLSSNFVSQQEIDERSADLASKQASVKSAQANVERLEALASYKSITAPFDGVVTARDTDVGALINAGVNAGPAMYVISDIRKLRVYVNVPQTYVAAIKIGARADITLPEYPSRKFSALVEASSQSVDASSGTTRMQLALDNADEQLMPGGYASVHLNLDSDVQPLHIPASALVFDKGGLRVATVGPGDHVAFKKVTIARDLGNEIEIATGLSPDDRVVVTPMDGVAEGDQVRVLNASGADGKPAVAAGNGPAKN